MEGKTLLRPVRSANVKLISRLIRTTRITKERLCNPGMWEAITQSERFAHPNVHGDPRRAATASMMGSAGCCGAHAFAQLLEPHPPYFLQIFVSSLKSRQRPCLRPRNSFSRQDVRGQHGQQRQSSSPYDHGDLDETPRGKGNICNNLRTSPCGLWTG